MVSISFIFKPGMYDEFHRPDDATQAVADGTEGFLGSESWRSEDHSVSNAIYWAILRHLNDFAQAVAHKEAKANYDRWYDGDQVVVAETCTACGDGRLPHITSLCSSVNERQS